MPPLLLLLVFLLLRRSHPLSHSQSLSQPLSQSQSQSQSRSQSQSQSQSRSQSQSQDLPSSTATSKPSVYEILPKYGLPAGLLPDTVKSYNLSANGSFSVDLSAPCYIQFDSYLVYYSPHITGTLKLGSINDIEGIEVRKLFVWIGVYEIQVDLPPSDYIYFHVGWITKKLDVDEFRIVHSCIDSAILQPLEGLEMPALLTE